MNANQIIENISIENIIPNRFQPRLTFDEEGLNELSASIKEHGIIQPLVLRKIGDKYEIIAGERRYKAATMAGLTEIPAIISNLNDNQSAEVALVENVQRKNLTAIEEAKSYKKILEKNYISQEELARRLGVSQSTIANKLRLLNLTNEVQEALLNERISERHARSLLQIGNKEQQIDMLNKVINERLTVRKLDLAVKELMNPTTEKLESLNVDETITEPTKVVAHSEETPIKPTFENDTSIDTLSVAEPIPVSEPITPSESLKESNDQNIESIVEPIKQDKEPEILEQTSNENETIENTANNVFDIPKEEFKSPLEIDVDAIKENAKDIIPKKTKNVFDEPSKNPFSSLEDEAANLSLDGSKPTEENKPEEVELKVPDFKPSAPIIIKKEETKERIKANNLPTVIAAFRELEEEIKKVGYKINSEEFDFEDLYQIIIKIEKE